MTKESVKSKAQASIEYLTTYGWAILAVMVVGITMWQMGFLSPRSETKSTKGFSGFEIADFTIYGDPNNDSCLVMLYAINSRPGMVVVTNLNTTVGETGWQDGSCAYDFKAAAVLDWSVNDANKSCVIGSGESMIIFSVWSPENLCKENEVENAEMIIEYKDLKTGIPHKSVGEVVGAVTGFSGWAT